MTAIATYDRLVRPTDWQEPEPIDWLRRKRTRVDQARLEIIGELVSKALAPEVDDLGRISSLLANYADESDPEKLGNLVDQLLELSGAGLGAWIGRYGTQWLKEKRTALAAVVEAAVRMSAPGTGNFLKQVFDFLDADSLVVAVAAQRVRMLSVTESHLRITLWRSFQRLIDRWEKLPSREADLARALPSVPYLGGVDSVPYLRRTIESGPPVLANSAVLGLLDWSSGSAIGIQPLNDVQSRAVYQSLTRRLKRELSSSTPQEVDLTAALVWAIGATATEQQLSDASSILAASFKRPKGLEDAAALRAATLLVRKYREKAWAALVKALGGPQSTACARFVTALVETARPR